MTPGGRGPAVPGAGAARGDPIGRGTGVVFGRSDT